MRNPVAQTTAAGRATDPSANWTPAGDAATSRGRNVTPARRSRRMRGSDDDVAAGPNPAGERGVRARGDGSGAGQPPEQVPAQQALRQAGRGRPDREGDLAGARQLLGDLQARVPGPDHDDRPGGQLVRVAVVGGVDADDVRREVPGDRRDVRHLERAGGDDDLAGAQLTAGRVRDEVLLPFQAR